MNREREIEKALCKKVWDIIHEWVDTLPRGASRLDAWNLKDSLSEVLPYDWTEVHGE